MRIRYPSKAPRGIVLAGAALLLAATFTRTVQAGEDERDHLPRFERIATVPNYLNNPDIAEETVSEIVSVTKNGKTLVYTDGERGTIGIVDISDPSQPFPAGTVGVDGEPTSVAVLGNKLALVAVNTSESFTEPSGHLAVIDLTQRTIVATFDLGGQPDSIAISPDRKYAAIAIENERDEDLTVDGVEGGLPQLPAGFLVIIDIKGMNPKNWPEEPRVVELTGLSDYAPSDPEPEFVDINDRNQAVVTLQENNHVAVVDLRGGEVVQDFGMGSVTLVGVDATEDGDILLIETLEDVVREPDAVAWIPQGSGKGKAYEDKREGRRGGGKRADLIATANEGDLFGGSRGFSIFDVEGNLVFDSGTAFEELAVRHGHYPENRSENKGSEPEAIEYGRFDGRDYLFVGSERGSFVAVYALDDGQPNFVQLLPGPLGPEGLLAIPKRDLLVVSGEVDDPSFGVRSSIMIYQLTEAFPSYPQILSDDDKDGTPIPWSAMSGMNSVPGKRNELLAVWDSFYSLSKIFTVDISVEPALVTNALPIVPMEGGSGNYDPEGVAVAPDGTYWIASEGNASGTRLNRLLQVDPSDGKVLAEIGLPQEIEDCRSASTNTGSLGAGFEGVAVLPEGYGENKGYKLLVAQQRGWDYTTPECELLDDDPTGANTGEPTQTRVWIYDPADGGWDHFSYELEPIPADASWVGLSEIKRDGKDGSYIFIERDNRTGDFAELKNLVKVDESAVSDDGIVSRSEKKVYDLIPDLEATNGWVTDKPEGVALTGKGEVFVITDNDGVDDWSGETWFLDLGRVEDLFDDEDAEDGQHIKDDDEDEESQDDD